MSAPDTDLEKQKKHHRGPLRGIAIVVIFAAVLLVALIGWLSLRSDGPEGAEEQIEVPIEVPDGQGTASE